MKSFSLLKVYERQRLLLSKYFSRFYSLKCMFMEAQVREKVPGEKSKRWSGETSFYYSLQKVSFYLNHSD